MKRRLVLLAVILFAFPWVSRAERETEDAVTELLWHADDAHRSLRAEARVL